MALLPVGSLLNKRAVVFLWATSPKLDMAIRTIEAWGLRYIGVAYVWIKTTKDGNPIKGQGVRPTLIKPLTEFVLAATNVPHGRPLELMSESQVQTVFHPRLTHSGKPPVVREMIVDLLGPWRRRLEIFARERVDGWEAIGHGVDGLDILDSMERMRLKV